MVGSGLRTPPPLRGGRAVVTGLRVTRPGAWRSALAPAATAVVLGLVGHRLAGGGGASAMSLLSIPLMILLCRISASREIGRGLMLALVLSGQAAVHAMAVSPQHPFAARLGAPTAGHTGHAGHTAAAHGDGAMTDPSMSTMSSLSMVAFHLVAGLAAAAVLRWTEARRWAAARGAALRTLIAALTGRMPTGLRTAPELPLVAALAVRRIFPDAGPALLPARRGPPRLIAC